MYLVTGFDYYVDCLFCNTYYTYEEALAFYDLCIKDDMHADVRISKVLK